MSAAGTHPRGHYLGQGMARAQQGDGYARAKARGAAARTTGEANPYAYGTYCWILFELGRGESGAPEATP